MNAIRHVYDYQYVFQLELLSMHPQLPGGAPLTTRSTSGGWKVFTRSEAVAALRLMVGSSGRDPMQFPLHFGKNRGGHPVKCARPLGLANPTGWKLEVSGFYDVHEGGKGGSRGGLHCTRPKRRIGGSGWPYGVSAR